MDGSAWLLLRGYGRVGGWLDAQYGAGRPRGRGQGGRDPGELLFAVGGGGEPGLEGRWRQVNAAVQHSVEERGVRGGGLVLGVGEVGHRIGAAEKDREQAARGRQVMRYADGGELGRDQLRERARERIDGGVHLGRAGAQRGQARRGGQRVPRQRARLVHR